MTKEGRLARGEENFEKDRFLKNPETIDYVASMKAQKQTEKPKETKDVKPNK